MNRTIPAARLGQSLRIARIALAFGRVERITRHEDGIRPETDTDHTVMLGLLAYELDMDLLRINTDGVAFWRLP